MSANIALILSKITSVQTIALKVLDVLGSLSRCFKVKEPAHTLVVGPDGEEWSLIEVTVESEKKAVKVYNRFMKVLGKLGNLVINESGTSVQKIDGLADAYKVKIMYRSRFMEGGRNV